MAQLLSLSATDRLYLQIFNRERLISRKDSEGHNDTTYFFLLRRLGPRLHAELQHVHPRAEPDDHGRGGELGRRNGAEERKGEHQREQLTEWLCDCFNCVINVYECHRVGLWLCGDINKLFLC